MAGMADGVSWSPFNLPADPPWQYDEAACGMPPVETGTRRRLMHPPPRHIRAGPPGLEFAGLDTAQVDLRRRLEEQWSADRKRDGQAVYDDTAPYQVRSRWDEAEGNDANALSAVRTLQFESRFESGNLQRAVKVGSTEYDLYLRPDKGCGHVQWYYFMVRNMKPGVPYVFNIVNFVKNKSLYNAGLRPLIYSEKEARGRRGCTGWHRTGSKCVYYQRGARYALTFETTFKHEGDTCFFAHCYPYTYSDSQLFLAGLLQDPERSKWCKRRELCRSLAGNAVDLLEIGEDVHPETSATKPSILLSARVHPGETQGSWAIQSCIEFLGERELMDNHGSTFLMDDTNLQAGVILGHYRCSLSGHDLNRVWANPDKIKHPCIWHIRDLVRVLSSQGLIFFCDFHGHSVKKNAFMYGCSEAGNQSCKPASSKGIQSTAMFPLLLKDISPAFSFNDCNFRVQRSKMNTGRVVVNRSFGVANSYTIEISFLGHAVNGATVHFKIEDLERLGRDFAVALAKYHFPTQYELTQPARHVALNPKGPSVHQDTLTGRGDHGSGSATTDGDVSGLDNQIDEDICGATRGVSNSASQMLHPTEHEDSMPPRLGCHLENVGDGDAKKAIAQQAPEWADYQDNFIGSFRVRRNSIAQEILQCQKDLEELSPTGPSPSRAGSSSGYRTKATSRNFIATFESVSTSSTLSAAKEMEAMEALEAAIGCGDESEPDSGDSSDDDIMPDCPSPSNVGIGGGASEKGESASDTDNDSNFDAEVSKLIEAAKVGQQTLRVGLSLTPQTLLQGCGSGFLPKLDIKKLGGNIREGLISPRLRSQVASIKDNNKERKDSPLGSHRRYSQPSMPSRVDPATAAQNVMAALQTLVLSAGERNKIACQHEPGSLSNAVEERLERRSSFLLNTSAGERNKIACQHEPGSLTNAVEERLERRSSSGPFHALSAAPKIAHICAALEGSCSPLPRQPQFPLLSSSEPPVRLAQAGEGMAASRGDFAPFVLKFAAAGVITRSLDSTPSHVGGRRIAQSSTEEDLHGLAQRFGPQRDGDLTKNIDARETDKRTVHDGELSQAVFAHPASASGVSTSNPHPPRRLDPHAEPGSRSRLMRIAKGRPGGFAQTMLARPGAPKTKLRNDRHQSTEERHGLAIVTTAKEYEDAMQAGAQSRAGVRAIQTTQLCAMRRVSPSPRRLPPAFIDTSSLNENPFSKMQASDQSSSARISTRDRLTFIRMLSVLKNKPNIGSSCSEPTQSHQKLTRNAAAKFL